MFNTKGIASIILGVSLALGLGACSDTPSGGVAGRGQVGKVKLDGGSRFSIYCDGDIGVYERAYGDRSGNVFLHPHDKLCANAGERVNLTSKSRVFDFGNDLKLAVWCNGDNAVYSDESRRTVANIDDERCAKN